MMGAAEIQPYKFDVVARVPKEALRVIQRKPFCTSVLGSILTYHQSRLINFDHLKGD